MCAHYVLRSNIERGRGSSYCGYFRMLGLVLEHYGLVLVGGGKINCSKNATFIFSRAQRVFGARQVFETTFGHIQNFWQKQIFENVPYLL